MTPRQSACIANWNARPRRVREAALTWVHSQRRISAARAGELAAIMGDDLVPDVPGAISDLLYLVEAFSDDDR